MFFGLVFGCFGFFCVLWRWNGLRSAVFDTPMERCISNGSRVVHAARVARIAIVL